MLRNMLFLFSLLLFSCKVHTQSSQTSSIKKFIIIKPEEYEQYEIRPLSTEMRLFCMNNYHEVIAISQNGTLIKYDTQKEIIVSKSLEDDILIVNKGAYNLEKDKLAFTTGSNKSISYTDNKGIKDKVFYAEGKEFNHTDISPSADYILGTDNSNELILWNTFENNKFQKFKYHEQLNSAFFLNDTTIATLSESGKIVFWNIFDKKIIKTIETEIKSLNFLSKNISNTLIAVSDGSIIKVFDVLNGDLKKMVNRHSYNEAFKIHPLENKLFYGVNNKLFLYNLDDNSEKELLNLRQFQQENAEIKKIDVRNNNIALSCDNGIIIIAINFLN